jgi:peptidoglycan/xylan/chitin deacetylase (PgdA/CDA1 family)
MRIALTVDTEHPDRPTSDASGNAIRILDVLAEANVRATFFVQGKWARTYLDLVGRIAGAGHLVGNHSYAHQDFMLMTKEGIEKDVTEARKALDEIGVDSGSWFRLPFGSGSHDRSVVEVVRATGYEPTAWEGPCDDWNPDVAFDDALSDIENFLDGKAADGLAVLLFHSWPDPAPMLIESLIKRYTPAAEFVALDDVESGALDYLRPRG